MVQPAQILAYGDGNQQRGLMTLHKIVYRTANTLDHQAFQFPASKRHPAVRSETPGLIEGE